MRTSISWLLALGLWAGASTAGAGERQVNPFRGQTQPAGQGLYNQHCAQCHGEDARRPMAEAPDLRRLNSFCRRLADAALKDRCLGDVDTYFHHSVMEGKVRAGVVHMPPWRGQLDDASIWAIRSFIEAQPLPPPRVETSVDQARTSRP